MLTSLTLDYARIAIKDLIAEAEKDLLTEFTCHQIVRQARWDTYKYNPDLPHKHVEEQAAELGNTLRQLGRLFCDENDIPPSYSFVHDNVAREAQTWSKAMRKCNAAHRAAAHAMRIAWLHYLLEDIGEA